MLLQERKYTLTNVIIEIAIKLRFSRLRNKYGNQKTENADVGNSHNTGKMTRNGALKRRRQMKNLSSTLRHTNETPFRTGLFLNGRAGVGMRSNNFVV